MKKNYLLLLILLLLTVTACSKNDPTIESQETSVILNESSENRNLTEQMELGVLNRTQFLELKDKFFYEGSILSISFDGNNYYLTGTENADSSEKIKLKLNKHDLEIESKSTEEDASVNTNISLDEVVGVDVIKGTVATAGAEMFTSWELRNEGDGPVYFLDTDDKINAETAEYENNK